MMDLKAVLVLSIAIKEHKIMIDGVHFDAAVIVRFRGVETKLITQDDGYLFQKLNSTSELAKQFFKLICFFLFRET